MAAALTLACVPVGPEVSAVAELAALLAVLLACLVVEELGSGSRARRYG